MDPASTTPPSMRPMSGIVTSVEVRWEGRRCSSHKKIPEPATAQTEATIILPMTLMPGAARPTSSSPARANWLVPAVVGETKRFRTLICMTAPATAIPVPDSTAARVRGRREIMKRCRDSPPDPPLRRSPRWKSATPTHIDTRQRTSRSPIPSSTRNRGFELHLEVETTISRLSSPVLAE